MLFTCFCTSASLKAILTDFSHLAQNRNKIQKFRRISRTTVPEKVFKITIKIFKLYNYKVKHLQNSIFITRQIGTENILAV